MARPTSCDYKLLSKLKSTEAATFALVFSDSGEFLLSGGEQEERVQVWDTQSFECVQTLEDPTWGQINSLCWINYTSTEDIGESVSIGTGCGIVALCSLVDEGKPFNWSSRSRTNVFDANSPVELQAFDSVNNRLAVASHFGQLKVYKLDDCVTLSPLWSLDGDQMIPRGLFFVGSTHESLVVAKLESGEVQCRDSATNVLRWSKTLRHGLGYATTSSDGATLVVQNLSHGRRDLYRFPSCTLYGQTPTEGEVSEQYATEQAFDERGRLVICGSNKGLVQIVSLADGAIVQSLRMAEDNVRVFAIASSGPGSERSLIAGASCGNKKSRADLHLWESRAFTGARPRGILRLRSRNQGRSADSRVSRALSAAKAALTPQTIVAVLAVLYTVRSSWTPVFWRALHDFSSSIGQSASYMADWSQVSTPVSDGAVAIRPAEPDPVAAIVHRGDELVSAVVEAQERLTITVVQTQSQRTVTVVDVQTHTVIQPQPTLIAQSQGGQSIHAVSVGQYDSGQTQVKHEVETTAATSTFFPGISG